jgi:hypothetical protein
VLMSCSDGIILMSPLGVGEVRDDSASLTLLYR